MKITAAFPFSDAVRDPERKESERQCAELMVASLRRSMPHAEVVMLTDDMGTKPLAVDRVLRKPLSGGDWVPWLLEFVSELPGNVLFLDSDIIVQHDLSALFAADADVIVTSRGPKTMEGRFMPFLLGVAASKKPEFWKEARDRVLAMTDPDDRNWWGSQLALVQMWQDHQQGALPWSMAAVSCDTYNYVPKSVEDAPADKWVIHYKGAKRKPWMVARWSHLLERQKCARCVQGRACWHVDCPHHKKETRVAA